MKQSKIPTMVTQTPPKKQEAWHKPTVKKLSVPTDTLGQVGQGQDAVNPFS